MAGDPKGRKWQLTINNPKLAKLTHDVIRDKLASLKSIKYYCMNDEIGNEKGTPHTHIYILGSSTIRFSTIQRLFPVAHIEKAYGSTKENKDYIQKTGKWKDTKKSETTIPDTFEEWGEMPQNENEENYPEIMEIINGFEQGKGIRETVLEHLKYAMKTISLEKLKDHIDERFSSRFREVEVIYVYDKNRDYNVKEIYEKHGFSKVCCIFSYPKDKAQFDNYHGQEVIVFQDYVGQIESTEFIRYLEGAPIYLPARYQDKIACYSTVYIISPIPPEKMYSGVETKRLLKKITYTIRKGDKDE